jgi:superkiller protein 3
MFLKEAKLKEAVSELQSAIQKRPDFLEAHYLMGLVLRQQGDLEGARAAFKKVLDLNPQMGLAYQGLGLVLREQGDVDGAVEAFHRAETIKQVQLTMQAAASVTSSAAKLLREGSATAAIEKLRFAITLNPNLAQAHYQLGLALRKHDRAAAEAEFKKAAQLDQRLKPPRE